MRPFWGVKIPHCGIPRVGEGIVDVCHFPVEASMVFCMQNLSHSGYSGYNALANKSQSRSVGANAPVRPQMSCGLRQEVVIPSPSPPLSFQPIRAILTSSVIMFSWGEIYSCSGLAGYTFMISLNMGCIYFLKEKKLFHLISIPLHHKCPDRGWSLAFPIVRYWQSKYLIIACFVFTLIVKYPLLVVCWLETPFYHGISSIMAYHQGWCPSKIRYNHYKKDEDDDHESHTSAEWVYVVNIEHICLFYCYVSSKNLTQMLQSTVFYRLIKL